METIGILIVIIATAWKLGLLKAARDTVITTSDMATNEIKIQAATHKADVINRASKLPELDAETVTKAQTNIATLNSFQL